jgi:predicted DNA-binding transcriptional regulator AlpA
MLPEPPDRVQPAAFDARAAAAFVGVSRAHWLRLAASGRAPRGMKLGARRVWSRAELSAWIEAGAPALVRWQAMRGERGCR